MKRRNTTLFSISLILIPFVFYLFFWWLDGAVWCADTASYVEMHRAREPLYPMYLAMFRNIFGAETASALHPDQLRYLVVAALGQSLLAAYVAYNLCKYFSERFELNRLFTYAVLAMPMATSLLCRFAAKRSSMYSNSILTEGLAISVYLLFVRFCVAYLLDHTKSSFFACVVMAIIGISLRKQMYILLVLFVIVGAYVICVCMGNKVSAGDSEAGKDGKVGVGKTSKFGAGKAKIVGALKLCVAALVVVASARFLDCTYNYVLFGHFSGHTEDNRFISTMAFYVSEREDVEHVDPRLQDLFLETYDICEAEGWLMHSAPSGWLPAQEHFGNNYDHIQIDTLEQVLLSVKDDPDRDYSWLGEGDKLDLIRASLNDSLITLHPGRLFKIFFDNLLSGLVTTAAVRRPLFCIYSLVVYVAYVVMLAMLIVRMRKATDDSKKKKEAEAALLTGILILLSILGNVSLVAAVIFTQTRYTIYNMPLLYIAMIVMLSALTGNENEP